VLTTTMATSKQLRRRASGSSRQWLAACGAERRIGRES
jgi:hypothetical protein